MRYFKLFCFLFLTAAIACAFAYKSNSVKQEGGMTVEDYNRKTANTEKIVLAYFHADWCVPCVKLKPTIAQLETEEKEKVEILSIDVDNHPKIALHFEINTLPLFIIYKNGKKVWENNTSLSKADIKKKLDLYK